MVTDGPRDVIAGPGPRSWAACKGKHSIAGAFRGKGEKTAGGRRVIVLGPIMIIFHHSNYIVECAATHTQTHTATVLPVQ